MKIGILRRDGGNITFGMNESISGLVEEYFGKKELFIYKDEEESTQMITFSLDNINSLIITHFIFKVSSVNSLYAVRLCIKSYTSISIFTNWSVIFITKILYIKIIYYII